MKDLTVIIPVYKEDAETVISLYRQVRALGAKCIVVNDGDTVDLPDDVYDIRYSPNRGYGYALIQGIEEADTPLVACMDGDGQHRVEDVRLLYDVYTRVHNCRMVVGCRWNLKEVWHRWFARKCLNFFASCLAGHYLVDLNSGLRIMDRSKVIGYLPILCQQFSFTTSCTMSMVADGHKCVYIPIEVKPRVYGTSHVRLFKDGFVTLWYIIKIGTAMRTRTVRKLTRNFLGRFMSNGTKGEG